jgi:hypothetical protein
MVAAEKKVDLPTFGLPTIPISMMIVNGKRMGVEK